MAASVGRGRAVSLCAYGDYNDDHNNKHNSQYYSDKTHLLLKVKEIKERNVQQIFTVTKAQQKEGKRRKKAIAAHL